MKRITIIFALLCGLSVAAQAQAPNTEGGFASALPAADSVVPKAKVEKIVKVSGLIHADFQRGQKDAKLYVGADNEDKDAAFSRIGLRRGFLKLSVEEGLFSVVFMTNITEKGFGLKDAYLAVCDPWMGTNSLRVGVFDRPFGYEISYSSGRRESPERANITQTLFPEEKDLGAALLLQPGRNSPLHFLKLEAGVFAGNGIKMETDSRKDFMAHLSASKALSSQWQLGGGLSYYLGGVYQGTNQVFSMSNKAFVANTQSGNLGQFARREYLGFDLQGALTSFLGTSTLRMEYIFGRQPGSLQSSKSPNAATRPTHDTYLRDFRGGYAVFVQSIGSYPVAVLAKYEFYDPNIRLSGNEIGQWGSGPGDIAVTTLGLGAFWDVTSSLRLHAYYDMPTTEKSASLEAYQRWLDGDVFTLRIQYRF
jgi:hypothetical protein